MAVVLLQVSFGFAQCPPVQMEANISVSTDGPCSFAIAGRIDGDPGSDPSVNLVRMFFDLDPFSSAFFESPVGIVPLGVPGASSVSVMNNGKRLTLLLSISPVVPVSDLLSLTLLEAKITGDPGDAFTVTRSSSSGVNIPANCPQSNATMGSETFPSEELSGMVESVSSSCPNTQNLGVEGVNITITDSNGEPVCDVETGNDGSYRCEVCPELDVTICADVDCPEPCGLTAADISIFRQIVLGVKIPLGWNVMAGDATQDGLLNTLDLLCLERKLLGFTATPGSNCDVEDWCKFVSQENLDNLQINTPGIGVGYDEPGNCSTTSVPASSIKTHFKRIMIGDVDGSCNDCIHGDGMGSNMLTIPFDQSTEGNVSTLTFSDDVDFLFLNFEVEGKVDEVFIRSSREVVMDYNQLGSQLRLCAYSEDGLPLNDDDVLDVSIRQTIAGSSIKLDETMDNLLSYGDKFYDPQAKGEVLETELMPAVSYVLYSFDGRIVAEGQVINFRKEDVNAGNYIMATFDKNGQWIASEKLAIW